MSDLWERIKRISENRESDNFRHDMSPPRIKRATYESISVPIAKLLWEQGVNSDWEFSFIQGTATLSAEDLSEKQYKARRDISEKILESIS